MAVFRFIFSILMISLLVFQAAADNAIKTSPDELEVKIDTDTESAKRFELWRNRWSDRILGTANRIDNWFASHRMYAERNDTYILLDNIFSRAPENDFSFRVRANLKLPGTMDRLNLFVESRRESFNSLTGYAGSGLLDEENETTEVGLRLNVLGEFSDYFSVTSRVGARTEGFDLDKVDPFVEVRGRYTQPLTEHLQVRGYLAPRYHLSEFRQLRAGFDFDYSPFHHWLFRQVNQSFWEDEKYMTTWLNGLQVFYTFKEGKVASVSGGMESNDAGGTKVDKYITSISYQQYVGWKWLTLQATNYWIFRKEDNFRRSNEFSLLMRVRLGAI